MDLKVVAREVEFPEVINGDAQIEVTLTRSGHLKFERLQGRSVLNWRKEKPDDPHPWIEEGRVLASAAFRQIP